MIRRLLMSIGAAALVGGWGLMQFADSQRVAFAGTWFERSADNRFSGVDLYTAGIAAMAIGAACLGGAWLRCHHSESDSASRS